ncbi:hypothetical protein CDD81_6837 [Ophiocordyceps australis]|uniref:Uncharacterized protein n=1 Tax=Ophiocordyceps australis TaxID=1399860 RepID=A0A2C5Y4N0_9HYPO|nr:hypothetical protein CDD81_6837 [Ophiocordyceps australis]
MFKTIKTTLILVLLAAMALAWPRALERASPQSISSTSTSEQPPTLTTTTIKWETVPASSASAPAATNSVEPWCECGYTYCASVLMGMRKPWSREQLTDAYCETSNATCVDGVPETSIDMALYLCLCDDPEQSLGDTLHLLCGCETCLVVPPDFRGRCEVPCRSGKCT